MRRYDKHMIELVTWLTREQVDERTDVGVSDRREEVYFAKYTDRILPVSRVIVLKDLNLLDNDIHLRLCIGSSDDFAIGTLSDVNGVCVSFIKEPLISLNVNGFVPDGGAARRRRPVGAMVTRPWRRTRYRRGHARGVSGRHYTLWPWTELDHSVSFARLEK